MELGVPEDHPSAEFTTGQWTPEPGLESGFGALCAELKD